jgi:hypothetical protein
MIAVHLIDKRWIVYQAYTKQIIRKEVSSVKLARVAGCGSTIAKYNVVSHRELPV